MRLPAGGSNDVDGLVDPFENDGTPSLKPACLYCHPAIVHFRIRTLTSERPSGVLIWSHARAGAFDGRMRISRGTDPPRERARIYIYKAAKRKISS